MYSSNQWSFNPAAYQNVPYEQVDWASLAQQWIKMKETMPSVSQTPLPPPAPQISKLSTEKAPVPAIPVPVPSTTSTNDIEGGEAPMEMDTKDDEGATDSAVTSSGTWNQWENWQSQWGWGWPANAGTVPSADNTQSTTSTVNSKGYWNENSYSNKTTHENWSKGGKAANRGHSQKQMASEQFPVMDAAKKKQLPAWIREGLNKMEREKQRKLERDRMIQEKMLMDKFKSESIETKSVNYIQPIEPVAEILPNQKSSPPAPTIKYHHKPQPEDTPRQPPSRRDTSPIRKTKDQIMEESMLKVRRILTEILLETTERQVQVIAKEEFRKVRTSASAPQIRKSNALSSLTGNLGLDAYESDSADSGSDNGNEDDGVDSDEELKMVIEKKKRDFEVIEDEIDEEIERQEAKERYIAQRDYGDEDDNDDEAKNEEREEDDGDKRTRNRERESGYGRDSSRERVHSSSISKTERDTQHRRNSHQERGDAGKVNGDESTRPAHQHGNEKPSPSIPSPPSPPSIRASAKTKRSRSSSRGSSSSSTSSTSSESSSSSSSSSSHVSVSSDSSGKKKSKRRDKKSSKSKREKHRRSRSRSRSPRYRKDSRSDRKRRSPSYRRRSPTYRRRSPNYQSRDSRSKYGDSPSSSSRSKHHRGTPESKRSRHRSLSRESSRHKYSRSKRR